VPSDCQLSTASLEGRRRRLGARARIGVEASRRQLDSRQKLYLLAQTPGTSRSLSWIEVDRSWTYGSQPPSKAVGLQVQMAKFNHRGVGMCREGAERRNSRG
jgi:hypothetical protein